MHTIPARPDNWNTLQQEAAWRYAKWGFNIFPLTRKKTPLFKSGQGNRNYTHDLDKITNWWTRFPTANIGARPFKNFIVIDIDPRNGGNDTWEQLNHGQELPRTLSTLTGSGGLHYWFKLPRLGDTRGKAGEGIDLKSERAQVVMPGSVHPDTGNLYVFHQWMPPRKVPLLPAWLSPAVYVPAPPPRRRHVVYSTSKNGTGLINTVLQAVDGQRNDLLNWAAHTAGKENLDIDQQLLEAAISIGLPEAEALATIRSGYTAGLKEGGVAA